MSIGRVTAAALVLACAGVSPAGPSAKGNGLPTEFGETTSSDDAFLMEAGWDAETLWEISKRVGLAALLGTAIALNPLRMRRRRRAERAGLAARAQILIAAAGSLMVIVISGSLARAFGLVGLGSFIRFRTSVKDPTDTAVLFLLVGVGMACGLGAYAIAVFGTAVLFVVLTAIEAFGRDGGADWRVQLEGEGVDAALERLAALPGARLGAVKVRKGRTTVVVRRVSDVAALRRALADLPETTFTLEAAE